MTSHKSTTCTRCVSPWLRLLTLGQTKENSHYVSHLSWEHQGVCYSLGGGGGLVQFAILMMLGHVVASLQKNNLAHRCSCIIVPAKTNCFFCWLLLYCHFIREWVSALSLLPGQVLCHDYVWGWDQITGRCHTWICMWFSHLAWIVGSVCATFLQISGLVVLVCESISA